jgi:hypothetical protein
MPRLTVRQVDLDDVFQDMARLALEHRPQSKAGHIIVLKAGKRTVRVLARGTPGRDTTSIYFDDAVRERLGVSSGQKVDFIIRPGGFWDEFLWGWQATNPVIRVGARLGILGLLLGIAGLILGAVAIG